MNSLVTWQGTGLLRACFRTQRVPNLIFPFDMPVQTAEYGTSQTPHYNSGPEPGSNHPVDKRLGTENGDQLFHISSEQKAEEMGLSCVKDQGYLWQNFLTLRVTQH